MRWPLVALAALLVALAGCTGAPPGDGSGMPAPGATGTAGQGS